MTLMVHSLFHSCRLLVWLSLILWITGGAAAISAAAPPAQTTTCTSAPLADDPSATVCISRVITVFDGENPKNKFFVSWRTRRSERGQVKLSGGATFDDMRGANFRGETHYVLINNLTANQTYQFDIVSGGKTYNNGGEHWSVNLGPAISSIATTYVVYGRVKNPNGSNADGAIVYATLRDADDSGSAGRSGLVSDIINAADGENEFIIDLNETRTRNHSAKFTFDPDKDQVVITAVGAQGSVSKTFKIADLHPPKPPPTLTLSPSGSGTVATATSTIPPSPTPTVPTSTPTLTAPPPALSETPIASLTPLRFTPTGRPRPPTGTPFVEPTLTRPKSTAKPGEPTPPVINPAQPSRVAATMIAQEPPEPTRTRVVRSATATPVTRASNPFLTSNALFTVLALVFFVGAVLLGLAAFFLWKR